MPDSFHQAFSCELKPNFRHFCVVTLTHALVLVTLLASNIEAFYCSLLVGLTLISLALEARQLVTCGVNGVTKIFFAHGQWFVWVDGVRYPALLHQRYRVLPQLIIVRMKWGRHLFPRPLFIFSDSTTDIDFRRLQILLQFGQNEISQNLAG